MSAARGAESVDCAKVRKLDPRLAIVVVDVIANLID